MDKLIEVLFKNINRSVIIITGIYIPGFITLFLKKYDMFKELDMFKLSVLSIIIACPSFIVLFVIISLMYFTFALINNDNPIKSLKEVSIITTGLNIAVFAVYIYNGGIGSSFFFKTITGYTIYAGCMFVIVFLLDKFTGKIIALSKAKEKK